MSSSRQRTGGLNRSNEYFVPRDGIDREVITADISRYLGNDALVRPGTYQDDSGRPIQGYFITAYRNLTMAMIADLKNDSARWDQERRKGVAGAARYQDSAIRQSSGSGGVGYGAASGYQTDTDPSAPPSYATGYPYQTPVSAYSSNPTSYRDPYAYPAYSAGYSAATQPEYGNPRYVVDSASGFLSQTNPQTAPGYTAGVNTRQGAYPFSPMSVDSGTATRPSASGPGSADIYSTYATPQGAPWSIAAQPGGGGDVSIPDEIGDDPFGAPAPEPAKAWGREKPRPPKEKPAQPPPPPTAASGSTLAKSKFESRQEDSSRSCPVCGGWPCSCGVERKDGKDPYSGTGLPPQGSEGKDSMSDTWYNRYDHRRDMDRERDRGREGDTRDSEKISERNRERERERERDRERDRDRDWARDREGGRRMREPYGR